MRASRRAWLASHPVPQGAIFQSPTKGLTRLQCTKSGPRQPNDFKSSLHTLSIQRPAICYRPITKCDYFATFHTQGLVASLGPKSLMSWPRIGTEWTGLYKTTLLSRILPVNLTRNSLSKRESHRLDPGRGSMKRARWRHRKHSPAPQSVESTFRAAKTASRLHRRKSKKTKKQNTDQQTHKQI